MTTYSPNQRHPLALSNKGSIYGKASKTPSPNSFQQPSRSDRFVLQNRVEVLSGQITLFPPRSQSIIIANDKARDPTTTRDS